MKSKKEIYSMFMARITEYKARELANSSYFAETTLSLKLRIEIALLGDILGLDNIPEEYWEFLEIF